VSQLNLHVGTRTPTAEVVVYPEDGPSSAFVSLKLTCKESDGHSQNIHLFLTNIDQVDQIAAAMVKAAKEGR
jgi:hypothetical protein